MKPDNVHLASLGTYLADPMSARSAVESGLYDAADFAESGQVSVLVADGISPPEMAVQAARQALTRINLDAKEIDFLIHSAVFFQGPEMWTPPGYILRELGSRRIPAVEVRQGCNGMLASVELALGQFAADTTIKTALLTTADNFNSPLIDRWRSGTIGLVAGDAGTALVLSSQSGFARLRSVNSTVLPEIEGMTRGAEPLHPPVATSGRPIDMIKRMEAFGCDVLPLPDAIDMIRQAQVELIFRTLDEAAIGLDSLRRVIYVNGSRWVVERILTEPLGVPLSRSTWEFGRTVGHLGASDHVASLDHLLTGGELGAGDHVLLVGGAPGWSVAAAVLTITEQPPWAESALPPARRN